MSNRWKFTSTSLATDASSSCIIEQGYPGQQGIVRNLSCEGTNANDILSFFK